VDVVIDSVSESVTEGGNLLLEDVNNPLKIGEFTVSSVGLLVVEGLLGGEVVLGINDILVRLSGELPSVSLSDEGDLKVDGELLKVSLSLDDISLESGDLSLGLDLELGGVEGGLDLVLFEEGGTFFEVGLESVEHSVDLVVEGTNEVGGVDGGLESFGVELISVSVLVTGLFTSRGSVIEVLEVSFVSVGVRDDNLSGLEELVDGVGLEEVLVLSKLVGEFTFGLGEDWGLSGSLGSVELGSEHGDGIESVLVLLKLLDEELVGLTSGDVELDELGGDGSESVIDPLEMVVGVLDLGLNPFSVLGGILGDFPVSVGNSGQVGDGLGTVDLLLSPTSVVLSLFFIDGILKFEKELFDGVDGIRGHSVGHHHVIDLRVEFGGGSTTKDNCD